MLRSAPWNASWLCLLSIPLVSSVVADSDQVAILPISEKFNDYAHEVKQYLKRYDIRAVVDERNEKIGRKIRDNEMKRIPYMLVVR